MVTIATEAAPMPAQRQGQTADRYGPRILSSGCRCLRVKIANSLALAQCALDERIPFDAAVVDLQLADGNASPLIQFLSERGIPVVITTGEEIDRGQPALSKVVAIQKPHADRDLVNAITRLVY